MQNLTVLYFADLLRLNTVYRVIFTVTSPERDQGICLDSFL